MLTNFVIFRDTMEYLCLKLNNHLFDAVNRGKIFNVFAFTTAQRRKSRS